MKRRTAVIVNPAAAGGRARRLWPGIAHQLRERLGEVTVRPTESAGHATVLARTLIEQGHDQIVAVGGDGTLSEVANGMLHDDQPLEPGVELGFLPVGTGSDFQRTLRIPLDLGQAIEVLVSGTPLALDVGRIRFAGHDGRDAQRYFVNLASFGLGGDVAARARNRPAPLGGKAAFLWSTLRAFLSYRGREVELQLDDAAESRRFVIANVAVGNGEYHGGGMHPCPGAALDDGLLEVTVIEHLSAWELLRDIRVLYGNDVYQHPKVSHFAARKVAARSREETRLEVDGEPVGTLPVEIEILPRRLPILVPSGRSRLGRS